MSEFKGIPTYRCERCLLASFDQRAQPVGIEVLRTFLSNEHIHAVEDVPRRTLHACPDGSFGIARFCGLTSTQALENWKQEQARHQQSMDHQRKPSN